MSLESLYWQRRIFQRGPVLTMMRLAGDEAGDRQPLTAPGYSSTAASRVEAPTPEPVVDSSKKKAMCPQRPEEYQAQQSVVREVYDPETGRMRYGRGARLNDAMPVLRLFL